MLLRRLFIRALLPLTWRHFARMKAARLLRFGVTETDSQWQILHALDAVDDPLTRAKMLQHALEEAHHASEFRAVALAVADALPPKPLPARAPIYVPETGLAEFVAYAYVGELDVFRQFDAYAAGIGDPDARRVFREAKLDELGHVGLTWGLLTGVEPVAAANRRVRWIRLRRLWDTWLRFGKALGDVNAAVVLGALYAIFGAPLGLLSRRRVA
ncbi:MAG: hypothetical protein ACOZNI_14615 [Myxococcota bacterium]